MSKTLICTVGLPYSGKSTWAKTQGFPIVNPDSVRLAIHGERYIAQAERFVWATVYAMIEALFLAGHDTVILDSTATTRKRRAEFKSDKWGTVFKLFHASKAECLKRAEKDERIWPFIEKMAAQFESLGPDEIEY